MFFIFMEDLKFDMAKFDPEIQDAIAQFLLRAKKIKEEIAHNEELKIITKKTLLEINEELQKLKSH
jgi:hypothetical protein